MHKKKYKNATNEISNNEKKRFFDIYRLLKPRVANLTPGIDSTLQRVFFLKLFFDQSKFLVANIAKTKIFV